MMNKEEEFHVLCELGHALYETASELGLTHAHCIWAGNFVHKVLKCLRIPHKVVPVGTVIFNEQGWKEAGIAASEMSNEAWNVSVSRYSGDRGGWSGHLIVETPNFFFDPNSTQFIRPEHDILLPPFIVIPNSELLSWQDTPTAPKGLTAPTPLWRETVKQMFETTEEQTAGFEAKRAYGSYRYFGVEHDSGTLTVYSFFRDPSNLAYRDSTDWHRNWNQLGCGRAMTRIQERRRQANLAKRHATEIKEPHSVKAQKVRGETLDIMLHPPV
jgi:hypothetical protein